MGDTSVLVAALVVVAFRRGRRPPPAGAAPSPWLVGAVALVASVLFLQTELPPGWWKAVAAAVLLIGMSILVRRWSRREGWDMRHRLALAAGALLAYAGGAFSTRPESAPKQGADHVVNAALAIAAVVVLIIAVRRTRPHPAERSPSGETSSSEVTRPDLGRR
jgi:peptidoglycan/LPS O-acetylase OafA/YrhL